MRAVSTAASVSGVPTESWARYWPCHSRLLTVSAAPRGGPNCMGHGLTASGVSGWLDQRTADSPAANTCGHHSTTQSMLRAALTPLMAWLCWQGIKWLIETVAWLG